ncbi:uncharacterized protein LOC120901101 [Anopheles arabiensis]|uniref:uncharacterized protein LOC120901101 n=1 Tax=Anopheles arabiensis TaxID=7173 RepID=UPI001AADD9A8|nr:uncharacterized protein LOC120901101 [Anopheles arabiensis]
MDGVIITVGDEAGNTLKNESIMATFNIESFVHEKSTWQRWVKRFAGAAKVFKVDPADMQQTLLHYMGSETYNVLCDLLSPDEPEAKTYDQIVSALDDHFDPKPLEMVELWKFRQRTQKEAESITEFVAALQREAKNCAFGDYLQKGLRNQFVFGLRDKMIRARLIGEKDLTFEKAKQVAFSIETVNDGVEILAQRAQSVNFMDRYPAPRSKRYK